MSARALPSRMTALSSIAVLAALMTGAARIAAQPGEPLDLSGASIIHDHGDWGYHVEAQTEPSSQPVAIIDGDDTTSWSSGNLFDLTVLPCNLLLTLPEPMAVGAIEVTTARDDRQLVRLSDLEVYARVGEGWALLADIKGNRETVIARALPPAEVTLLRLRVMGNERPDNIFAVIRSLRLFAPAAGADPVALQPAEVAGESLSEQLFIREALGLRPPEPRVRYDPQMGYLGYVRAFLDTMIAEGTDRYGPVHSPQFANLLDLQTHQHPGAYLPSIPGQRLWDRPMWGSNLSHEIGLLEALDSASTITGDGRYRDAARAALQFFLDHCTDTPTGLWPWGEHAYWNFYTEAYDAQLILNHEAYSEPTSFWEAAWQLNPDAVRREADGLINHVKDLSTFAFCRHAEITRVLPDPRPPELLASMLDFPRIGGDMIHVWAFVWSKSADAKYYGWAERMLDYFGRTRLADSGMLPVLSQYAYRPALQPSPDSSLSVGLSMLEAAKLMPGTELGPRLQQFGTELLEAVAANYSAEPPGPGLRVVPRARASGGRTVSFWEQPGGWLDLRFDLPQAGDYRIALRYALAHDRTRRVVLVNGTEAGEFELPRTGDWDTFEEATAALGPLTLPAGEVVVRLLNRDSVGLSLDWLALEGVNGAPRVQVEAEGFVATGGVEATGPTGLVVGFDSGSIVARQIPDRPIVPYVSGAREIDAFRATGDRRHLEAARRIAEAYAAIEQVPAHDHIHAGVFGGLVALMLDMYEFDPDPRWLAAAERFAQAGIEGLYRNGLFRGATGQWYYDEQLGVSSFASALLRLHAVTQR